MLRGYQNLRQRFEIHKEMYPVKYHSRSYTVMDVLSGSDVQYIDNLPLFELISVTHKQSEQHSEPVQLPEVLFLWQYHAQCVSKQ